MVRRVAVVGLGLVGAIGAVIRAVVRKAAAGRFRVWAVGGMLWVLRIVRQIRQLRSVQGPRQERLWQIRAWMLGNPHGSR